MHTGVGLDSSTSGSTAVCASSRMVPVAGSFSSRHVPEDGLRMVWAINHRTQSSPITTATTIAT